jgi:hypothetical protein
MLARYAIWLAVLQQQVREALRYLLPALSLPTDDERKMVDSNRLRTNLLA